MAVPLLNLSGAGEDIPVRHLHRAQRAAPLPLHIAPAALKTAALHSNLQLRCEPFRTRCICR
jgi:hypothetical protein